MRYQNNENYISKNELINNNNISNIDNSRNNQEKMQK